MSFLTGRLLKLHHRVVISGGSSLLTAERESTKPCFWDKDFSQQKIHKTLFLGARLSTAERKSTKLCFWDQNFSQQKGSPQNLVSGSKTSQHEGSLQNLTVGIVYLTVQVTGTRMSASVAKCICKQFSSFFFFNFFFQFIFVYISLCCLKKVKQLTSR